MSTLMGKTMRIDMTGRLVGHLRVTGAAPTDYVGKDRQPKSRWYCQCVCGREVIVQGQSLRSGNTHSCGCLGNHERRYAETRERKIWRAMISRCHNPNSSGYHKYGARGIRVCREWKKSFDAFLSHVGYCPSKAHTIDRINGRKGYRPGNVRWATHQEQGANKRNSNANT